MIRLLLLCSLFGVSEPSPSAIRLQTWPPHFAIAPCDLRVQIRIAPIDTDRELWVIADGPVFYRSSAWTLDGEHAARLYSFWWRALPAGEYQIVAAIGSSRRIRARATSELRILE